MKAEEQEPSETASEFYARKSMLALESIALALGTLVAFACPTLESIEAKLPTVRKVKRKRRKRRTSKATRWVT